MNVEETAPNKQEIVKRTVLVIDDEEIIRETVKDILSFQDLPVLEAEDGATGIKLFQENIDQIAIVILDLSMPGLSGVETYKKLREINSDVYVMISSAIDKRKGLRDFQGEDRIEYLQKPYQLMDFLQRVNQLLHQYFS